MESEKVLEVVFVRTQAGGEPVKDWLKELPSDERRMIGFKIKEVEFGWPIGMPLTKSLGEGLWEVRVSLGETERIARIIFGLDGNKMLLLHGFIKKDQKIPQAEIAIARNRFRNYRQSI